MDIKSAQNENASVEQWQIGILSIMNKAAGTVTMWKISKKVQEVERVQYWCSRKPTFLHWILGRRGSVKSIHIDGSLISNLVIGTVFSFTSGVWRQHMVDLGSRDNDTKKHSQWSWNGPSRGYYRHLTLPGKVFVWSLYVLVCCSLYPARFIAVLIALSVIGPAVFSLAVRNLSRNVLMLL